MRGALPVFAQGAVKTVNGTERQVVRYFHGHHRTPLFPRLWWPLLLKGLLSSPQHTFFLRWSLYFSERAAFSRKCVMPSRRFRYERYNARSCFCCSVSDLRCPCR